MDQTERTWVERVIFDGNPPGTWGAAGGLKAEPVRTRDLGDVGARKRKRAEMENEAREWVKEQLRVTGMLPKWELYMKDRRFREAVEAADQKVYEEAQAEIYARVSKERELLEQLKEEQRRRIEALQDSVQEIATRLTQAEKDTGRYHDDPNGYLLLMKLVTSFGAALEAIAATAPNLDLGDRASADLSKLIGECRARLSQLAQYAQTIRPANMDTYIQGRRTVLGTDINKGLIEQEGAVGADVEMQLGGLIRSTSNQVEFEPGQFSPYVGNDPDAPHQMDVFGPTVDVVKNVIVMATRMRVVAMRKRGQKLTKQQEKDILATANNEITDAMILDAWSNSDGIAPLQLGGHAILPSDVFADYLKKQGLLKSLEAHFAKGGDVKKRTPGRPTIIPFDVRGLASVPGLLEYVRSQIAAAYPDQAYLILWYNGSP